MIERTAFRLRSETDCEISLYMDCTSVPLPRPSMNTSVTFKEYSLVFLPSDGDPWL